MNLHNEQKKYPDSEMYFHVPVCADLIRVLAHVCAWDNIRVFI